ncbi:MAG: hypothetical protein JJU02_13765 [Cryomorphaceae bacterium]|nr:hypothetical protein [Cryomorphaceae bacterium]
MHQNNNLGTIIHPVFQTGMGKRIQNVSAYVKDWKNRHPKGKVFVGCDSKVRGNLVKYAIVICLWDVGRGVSELYRKTERPYEGDRFSRLWHEVMLAAETASALQSVIPEITVHVDINSDERFASNRLYDASIGLITSMGFNAAGKPNAWAATCGANRHCQ